MSEIEKELSVLIGLKVAKVEIISICHILRLHFDDVYTVDLNASWRLRSDKNIILGSSDIDFYVEYDDDDLLDQDDQYYAKKAGSLVGKKLVDLSIKNGDMFFEFTGKRFIDFFDLSADGLSIPLIGT